MKKSKIQQIEKYLKDGNTLTSIEAIYLFGHTRLADAVFQLKKKGLNITTMMIEVPDRSGNVCRVARYKIV